MSVVVQMGIKIYCSAPPPSSILDFRPRTKDEDDCYITRSRVTKKIAIFEFGQKRPATPATPATPIFCLLIPRGDVRFHHFRRVNHAVEFVLRDEAEL